ncbi:MAG: OmpA family protein [Flavobacteriales bacterium]|nr:OmpA family protein [Flavobacteriales bacterium]
MIRQGHMAVFALIAQCAVGQWTYEVIPSGIRPGGDDYAPVILDSSIVFCSMRERPGIVRIEQADTHKPLSDLYRVHYSTEAGLDPELFDERFTTDLNDGPASFTGDGRSICFTRNTAAPANLNKLRKGNGSLGLFFSEKTAQGWSETVAFPYNSEEYDIVHPAFSEDGSLLIFASNMPDGAGGMDLFSSERKGGTWSAPEKLRGLVNGPDNEVFPFLHANGTLYFASSRPGGPGGLDIYRTEFVDGSWSEPEVLPEPINSTGNDLGYTSFFTDISGAFSSDRSGRDEIYLFTKNIPRFVDAKMQEENNYCYRFEAPRVQDLGDLPLNYRWDLGNGEKLTGTKVNYCYETPGAYHVRLQVVDTITQAVFFQEAEYVLNIENIHQPYIRMPDSVRTGKWVSMDGTSTYLPDLYVEDMRWDLGDGALARGNKVEHRFSKEGTYTVKLDVMGVDLGTGELKAHCVTKDIHVLDRFRDMEDDAVLASYQDATGVTHEFEYRILPHDEMSLAIKQGEDASFTIELFASKERMSLDDPVFAEIRKHYPVIERYDPVRGTYTYSVGEAKTLAEMYEIYQKVKELQFLDAEMMALDLENVIDLSQLASTRVEDLNNTVVRASTVFFRSNESTIDPAFEPSLKDLIDLMAMYPDIRLVIEAHTDSKGTEQYNRSLSDRRAQALVQHFEEQGVAAERLIPLGLGEDRPISDNRTAEGRGRNRRVEFRLSRPQEEQALQLRDPIPTR